MFTTARREHVLDQLISQARADPTITAAAIVGSRARQQTDPWSDIDLVLRLEEGVSPRAVADAWTTYLQTSYEVVDQLDLWSGPALYRVFLLADSLQIDLSFWPAADFASTGEAFDLVFGLANPSPPVRHPDPYEAVGWGWLYSLHARSALARGNRWQALQMLEGLRQQIITLACLRHELPAHQGRGVDQLPADVLASLHTTLVPLLSDEALTAAFTAAVALLLAEADLVDSALARRLQPALAELVAPEQ